MEDVAAKKIAPWGGYIDAYERLNAYKSWKTKSAKIIRRYLDVRGDDRNGLVRFNVLWSNVETLRPALYASRPKPEVYRRFLDKDPTARCASQALENCLSFFVGFTAFDGMMRQVVMDYLLPGRGVAWVRYVPHTQPQNDVQITDDTAENPEVITYEEVIPDYVHWQDFGHNVARTWEEVTCVWRIVYMTKEQVAKRFGKKIAATVPYDCTAVGDKDDAVLRGNDTDNYGDRARIYEVWDKDRREVIWLSKQGEIILDRKPDPLGLDKFFPCPKPVFSTVSNDSLIPVPDYVEYQDQARELDEITMRIGLIRKSLKVAGVYDASVTNIDRILADGVENVMVPVDGYAMLAEKGGMKGVVDFFPFMEVAETLRALYDVRERVKNDLYEITGISDIVRGASVASETATAQQIKSNYATMRLNDRQRLVQQFARDVIEIMGNIIAKHFQPETIMRISNMQLMQEQEKMLVQQAAQSGQQLPPDVQVKLSQPSWEDVIGLLRSDPERQFRVEVETNSTIEADRKQDQENRTAFLNATSQFLEKAIMAAQADPKLGPLAGEMLRFGIRGFPIGRELEGVFDETIEAITQAAAQPQEPPQDPAMVKAQIDAQKAQSDAQLDQQRLQMEGQKNMAEIQLEQQRVELERERVALERERIEVEKMRVEVQKYQVDTQAETERGKTEVEIASRHIEAQTKLEHDAKERERDRAINSAEKDKDREHTRSAQVIDIGAKREERAEGAEMGEMEDSGVLEAEERPDRVAEAVTAMQEGLTELGGGINALANAILTMADDNRRSMQSLHDTMTADVELVRDPATGKAIGTKRVRK
jgi:hypothetical protein